MNTEHAGPRRGCKCDECKAIQKERSRKYYEANREKIKKQSREYYEANREEGKKQRAEYYAANREKMQEAQRQWQKDNPERVREIKRRWEEANRDEIRKRYREKYAADPGKELERLRKLQEANPENRRATLERYYETNQEKILERKRAYYKANPDKANVYVHVRRARERGAFVEQVDLATVFERDNWTCHICGESIDPNLRGRDPMSASLDHYIPLAKGGKLSYENCATSHLRCNQRKNAKLPEEWMGD